MTATKEKAIIKAADMPDVRVGDRDARADAFSRRATDAPTRRRDKVNENDDDDERDD